MPVFQARGYLYARSNLKPETLERLAVVTRR